MIPAFRRCCDRHGRLGDPPVARSRGLLHQPAELVVGAQGIAAGRDIVEDDAEDVVGQPRIGRGGADFGQQLRFLERARRRRRRGCAGPACRACRGGRFRDRARPLPPRRAPRGPRDIRSDCRGRWCRGSARRDGDWRGRSAATGGTTPLGAPIWMTRSTSPQSIPRSRLEVQTSALQLARRHRRFDLASRFERQAAMVDPDRQAGLVYLPQVLEDEFAQAAGVAEDEGRLVLLDLGHHLFGGIAARMPRPRHAVLR